NSFQARIALDLAKCNWSLQWFNCCKIDGGPIAFLCRWVRIGSPRNFGNSDYSFFVPAVIEEDFIARSHFAKIISRSEIAHAGPVSFALGNKIRPRIGRRLLFYQPERFHKFQVPSSRHPQKAQVPTLK